MVKNPDNLHKTVAQRNMHICIRHHSHHLGMGKGMIFFHGQDKHKIAKSVLSGTLDWKHPTQEINTYIDNLPISFDKENLKEEAKEIHSIIIERKFWHYFCNKKESTE